MSAVSLADLHLMGEVLGSVATQRPALRLVIGVQLVAEGRHLGHIERGDDVLRIALADIAEDVATRPYTALIGCSPYRRSSREGL